MAAIVNDDYDIFGRSNRRRCVRGRSAYAEPSDNLAPQEDKTIDGNFNNSEVYPDCGNNEEIEVDDVDEEAVTIDLSDFLNANPLLTESLTENAVDSGALTDESHSQFRVTSSLTDSSQIVVKDLPLPKATNPLESTAVTDSVAVSPLPKATHPLESIAVTDSVAVSLPEPTLQAIYENGVDVCVENSHSEIINENVSIKENIVNGVKYSPDKYLKPKLTGPSRPLKNSKNILSRIKNFNKNNVRVFGKYPVVQCERLDIDSFVKKNNIRVGNWPLLPVNNRKPKAHRNAISSKKGNPLIIRPSPKLFNKPISFNRSNGSLDKARSILVDSLESRMAKSGKFHQPILQSLSKSSYISGEKLIKLVHQNVTDARLSNKLNVQKQKFPIITSVNKMVGSPKTYQLISPKSEKNKSNFVTPILPKPAVETIISPMLLKDFTVIQPYVEDPTSPIKPKPILTVPLDIVPSIEAVNQQTIIHSSHVKSPLKPLKPAQSVFLNGAIQQISIPKKVGNKPLAKTAKAGKSLNISENFVKGPVSATSVVVDAMQSVFNKTPFKKAKPKQNVNKNSHPIQATVFPGLGCNAYNSTLNDMLFGFDDFGDESFDVNSSISFSSEPCDSNVSSTIIETTNDHPIDEKETLDIENEHRTISFKDVENEKLNSKRKVKRKKKTSQSLHDSDTWSASEGETAGNEVRMSYTARRKQRKLSGTTICRKARRSSSSNLNSNNTLSQDSDSAPVKAFSSPSKTKPVLKQKEIKIEPPEEIDLQSGKVSDMSGLASSKPNSESQEKGVLCVDFESSNNLNSRSIEETPDLSESIEMTIDMVVAKSRKELNQNSVKSSPKKLSTKNVKEKSKLPIPKGKKLRFRPKFQIKTKKTSTKLTAGARKKLSRPADIIKEINTITGASLPSVKKNKGKVLSTSQIDSHDPILSDSCNTENNTNNKSPKQRKGLRSKTKKNKTLQVLFKRPTRRRNSQSLSTQEDATDLLAYVNESSSLSENSFNSTVNDGVTNQEVKKLETTASSSELKSAEEQDRPATSSENDSIDNIMNEPTIDNSGVLLSKEVSNEDTTDLHEKLESDLLSANLPVSENLDMSLSNTKPIEDSMSNTNADGLSNQSEVDDTSVTDCTETGASIVPIANSSSENCHVSEIKETSESAVNKNNSLDSVDDSLPNENLCAENIVISKCNDGLESKKSVKKIDLEPSEVNGINNDASVLAALSSDCFPEPEISTPPHTNYHSKLETNLTCNTLSEISDAAISSTNEPSFVSKTNETPDAPKKCEVKKRGRPKKISNSIVADSSAADLSPKESLPSSELQTSTENSINNDACELAALSSESSSPPEISTAPKTDSDSKVETNLTSKSVNEISDVAISNTNESLSESNVTLDASKKSEVKKRGRPKKITNSIKADCPAPDSTQNSIKADCPAPDSTQKKRLCLSEFEAFTENILPLGGKRTCRNRTNLTSTPVSKYSTSDSINVASVSSTTTEQKLSLPEGKTTLENNKASELKITVSNKRNLASSRKRKNNSFDTSSTDVPETHTSINSESNTAHENGKATEGEVISKSKKKCPKIKISVAKSAKGSNSRRSLRNWYVSERKASTDSIPSDEITVLKPSERAELNRIKEAATLNPPVRVESLNNERNLESTTFVTNAIVHVDATDIADDEISNIDTHSKNQFIISSLLDNLISSIEKRYSIETSKLPVTSQECSTHLQSVPPIKIKEEPIDEEESADVSSNAPIVNVKIEDSWKANETKGSLKLTDKRKSMPIGRNSIQIGKSPVRVMAEAIISTSKKKVLKKLKPQASTPQTPPISKTPKTLKKLKSQVSTPQTAPISQAPNGVQSAPPRMRGKKFSYEAVTLPFSMGWMRELVHRCTSEAKPGRRMSDVYYFSPEGAKLRSMVEISNYLSRHPESKLSIDNFTYAKELIYREPFEIERSAKQKSIYVNIKTEDPKQSGSKKPTSASTPKITKFMQKLQSTPSVPPKTSTPKSTSAKKSNAQTNEKIASLKDDIAKVCGLKNADDTPTLSGRQRKRKVPFDNSHDESGMGKKNRLPTRRHSTSNISSADLSKELQAQNKSNLKVTQSKKPTTVKLSPQVKNLPSSRKTKQKQTFAQSIENYIQPPCTSRCLVPKYQQPSIQCTLCLRYFHPKCVSSKSLKFACRPCMVTQYNNATNAPSTSSAVATEEVDLPEDIDLSLLFPDISMHVPEKHSLNPIPGAPYKTYSISCTPFTVPKAAESNAIPTASPSPPSVNSAPGTSQLLSHLLQKTVLPTVTPVPPSEQMLSPNSRFLLPSTLKNSPHRKVIRVCLPVGTDSVSLANSLVIRKMSGRLMVYSKSFLPPGQIGTNVRLNAPLLNISSAGANVSYVQTAPNLLTTAPTQCPMKLEMVDSVGSDAHKNTIQITNVQSLAKNYSKNLGSTDQPSGPPSECQHSSLSEANKSTEDPNLDPFAINMFMKSIECLKLVFHRLNVRDLLSITEVSPVWKHLGQHSSLWEKVSFQGMTITDWQKCCQYLYERGTMCLDLRGIVHPNILQPWRNLEKSVPSLGRIEELIVDHLPPTLLKAIISNMPLLRRLECHFVTTACTEPSIWKTPCEIELEPFRCLGRLVRLKIGSGGGIVLGSGSNFVMPYLPNLRHVALTGFDFHSHVNVEFLSQLNDLISLELGNISSIEPGVYPLLGTLTKLKSLRLENGGSVDEVKFSQALSKMQRLEVLELMNFKISSGLANCLKSLNQLIHFNVWPDTTTESAVINQNLLTAMSNLKNLKYVCWGIIAEGDVAPDVLQLRYADSSEDETTELTFEDLFKTLDKMFPECRVEVKCVPRKLWREFCSIRK